MFEFDLEAKIKQARKETIGLSVITILIGGLLLYAINNNDIEVSASQQEDTHVVESGDTLWRISINNQVSLETLKHNNGLSDNLIYPGDRLRIPNTKQAVATSSSQRVYGNELSATQYETLLMVVQQESGGHDYDAVLAVMSVITNRVDTNGYDDTVWEVITASGQFEAYGAGHYLRHEGEITQTTKDAVNDALNGKKNVDVLNFWSDWYYNEKGRSDSEAVNIGGNVFFNL